MKSVLDDVTKVISFINRRPIHCRMFKSVCGNLGKQHINLLLYTEIWWLSRVRVLNKVFELKGVSHVYFQESSKPDFAKSFENEEWLEKLTYL